MTYNGIDVSQSAENGFYSDGCNYIYGPFVDSNTYTCEGASTSPVNQGLAFSNANYNSFKQSDVRIQPCNAIKNMLDIMLEARDNSNDNSEDFNRVIVFFISSVPDTDNDNCDIFNENSDYYPFYKGLSVLFVTTGFLCDAGFSVGFCTETTNRECLQPSLADWFDNFKTTTGIHSYVLTPWDGFTAENNLFNYGTSARKMLDPLSNWICDGLFLFCVLCLCLCVVCCVCVFCDIFVSYFIDCIFCKKMREKKTFFLNEKNANCRDQK